MRSRLLAVSSAAVLPFALVGVASAQATDGFVIAPTSGPPGTTISVTGTCVPAEDAPDPIVLSYLLDPDDDLVDYDDAELNPAGAFSLSLTVPGDAQPSPDYLVVVECWDDAADAEDEEEYQDPFFADYEEFTVTGTPRPSPSPTQTAGPTPASPKSGASPTASATPKTAATAVTGQPTYTG
jgi:hypothetical protein